MTSSDVRSTLDVWSNITQFHFLRPDDGSLKPKLYIADFLSY